MESNQHSPVSIGERGIGTEAPPTQHQPFNAAMTHDSGSSVLLASITSEMCDWIHRIQMGGHKRVFTYKATHMAPLSQLLNHEFRKVEFMEVTCTNQHKLSQIGVPTQLFE